MDILKCEKCDRRDETVKFYEGFCVSARLCPDCDKEYKKEASKKRVEYEKIKKDWEKRHNVVAEDEIVTDENQERYNELATLNRARRKEIKAELKAFKNEKGLS